MDDELTGRQADPNSVLDSSDSNQIRYCSWGLPRRWSSHFYPIDLPAVLLDIVTDARCCR